MILRKIILVISDSRGKSIGFVTSDLHYLTLESALLLVRQRQLAGVFIAKKSGKSYLRSERNSFETDNLNSISVNFSTLFGKVKEAGLDTAVSSYLKIYGKFLEKSHEPDELIYLDRIARISKRSVIGRIRPLVRVISEAATKHGVDPDLLGAILIDELARTGPDDLLDILARWGSDKSVGLAQVKVSTARDLIRRRILEFDRNISDRRLYKLLMDDVIAVKFAAAYLQFIQSYRKKANLRLTPEILCSCYSAGHKIKSATRRGKQIAGVLRGFYGELSE